MVQLLLRKIVILITVAALLLLLKLLENEVCWPSYLVFFVEMSIGHLHKRFFI